jgi:hypothetical protein
MRARDFLFEKRLIENPQLDEKYRPLYEKALKVFESPAAEAALTDMLGTIQGLKDQGQIDPKVAAPVFDAIKKAFAKAERSFYGQMGRRKQQTTKDVTGKIEKEYQKFWKDLETVLVKVAKKIDGFVAKDIDPDEKVSAKQKKERLSADKRVEMIKQSLAPLFKDPKQVSAKKGISWVPTREEILQFLEDCVAGNVIDMPELVKFPANQNIKTGNIVNHFQTTKHYNMYKFLYEMGLLNVTLVGTTSGNVGPGEFALAMLGSPVEKGQKGDLKVGDVEYEVKAGSWGGGQSLKTGGRMNSTDIRTGKLAKVKLQELLKNPKWKRLVAAINNKDRPKLKMGAKGSIPGMGATHVPQWNALFKMAGYGRGQVAQFLAEITRGVLVDYDAVNTKFTEEVGVSIPAFLARGAESPARGSDTSGQLDQNNLNYFMTRVTYLAYHLSDGITNIIFINKVNGNYTVIGDQGSFVDAIKSGAIKIAKNISWADTQQKATLHYVPSDDETWTDPSKVPVTGNIKTIGDYDGTEPQEE